MNKLTFLAILLTFVTSITLLQSGAIFGWWQIPMASWAFAGLAIAVCSFGLLVRRRRRHPQPISTVVLRQPVTWTMPASPAIEPAPSSGSERRAHLRYQVIHPAMVEVRGKSPTQTTVRDISQGGARIANGYNLAPGTRGLLHIDGVALPVPFDVVSDSGSPDLRVKFELDGLGRAAFHRRLIRLLTAPGSVGDQINKRN